VLGRTRQWAAETQKVTKSKIVFIVKVMIESRIGSNSEE
jgi:hypothetical protein